MKGWRRSAVLLIVVATCVAAGQWLRGEEPSARPVRIGAVDLARVWQTYDKKIHLDKELDQLGKLKEAPWLEKKAEVDQLQQKIDLLAAGSAQRDEAERELAQKKFELDALARASRQELGLKLLEYMDLVYNDIVAAVNEVAEREGYDLVLQTSEAKRRATSIQEFQARIEGRLVLYSSSQLELTDTVLALLNDRFAQSGQAKEQSR